METIEKLGAEGIEIMCKELLRLNDYKTIAFLNRKSKQFHTICQPLLTETKGISITIATETQKIILSRNGMGIISINYQPLEQLSTEINNPLWRSLPLKKKVKIFKSIDYNFSPLEGGGNYLLDWLLLALIEGLVTKDLTMTYDEKNLTITVDDRPYGLPYTATDVLDWNWRAEVEDIVGNKFPTLTKIKTTKKRKEGMKIQMRKRVKIQMRKMKKI
jgi:hypothetical protein